MRTGGSLSRTTLSKIARQLSALFVTAPPPHTAPFAPPAVNSVEELYARMSGAPGANAASDFMAVEWSVPEPVREMLKNQVTTPHPCKPATTSASNPPLRGASRGTPRKRSPP